MRQIFAAAILALVSMPAAAAENTRTGHRLVENCRSAVAQAYQSQLSGMMCLGEIRMFVDMARDFYPALKCLPKEARPELFARALLDQAPRLPADRLGEDRIILLHDALARAFPCREG